VAYRNSPAFKNLDPLRNKAIKIIKQYTEPKIKLVTALGCVTAARQKEKQRRLRPPAPGGLASSFQRIAMCIRRAAQRRPDCVAGHLGFEPANPSASYLIGIP
jgi:hypothetical protein